MSQASTGTTTVKPEISWPEGYQPQKPAIAAPHAAPPATNWPPNLRRKDASRYLQIVHGISLSPATLAKVACVSSTGPLFISTAGSPSIRSSSLTPGLFAGSGRYAPPPPTMASSWPSNAKRKPWCGSRDALCSTPRKKDQSNMSYLPHMTRTRNRLNRRLARQQGVRVRAVLPPTPIVGAGR
jgi:hypothetical protein